MPPLLQRSIAPALIAVLLSSWGAVTLAQQFGLPPEPDAAAPADAADERRITGCSVDLVDNVEVPASVEGVIVYLGVKEGAEVRAEDVLAQVDDREAEQQKRVAEFAHQAALARAADDIEKKYSLAAASVALADWESLEQANESTNKAVTETDIRRAKLEYERARLGADKADKDRELALLDARTKEAELAAADLALDRRRVLIPFDGQVLEVLREQNEWVRPGDTIARVARLDKLQVDGWVTFRDHDPREIDGCEVTVEVSVGRGETATATGRVVYVSSVAEGFDDPRYTVRAEIANRREGGRWVISPGLEATMVVHLGTGGGRQAMNEDR